MTFYSNLAETAARLLAKYGQDVIVYRANPAAYDTSSSSAAAPELGQTFKGLPLDVDSGVRNVQGNQVEADDKMLLLEAGAQPKTQDVIAVPALNNVRYTVLSVKTLSPGGTAVIYEAHIRK